MGTRSAKSDIVASDAGAARHNLPAEVTRLIGRERECERLNQLLLEPDVRLVTLSGVGGCGKTRLALAVAMTVLDNFPAGVWVVELAPLSAPPLLASAIAASLRVREQPGQPLEQTLVEALRNRSLLLVLDNCEHLVAACAPLVDALLRACPAVRILATSREPLRLTAERVWRVPPLASPDLHQVTSVEQLNSYPAVRLFVERAQAVQPTLALTAGTSAAVAGICARLDGLPLAIELAAGWARVLAPEQILVRLDDAFRLLVGGSRSAPTRQQTLRATLDWSNDLLSDAEHRLFRRLAIFAGGLDLEAAEAIWRADAPAHRTGDEPGSTPSLGGEADFAVLDVLTRLVDKSLVVAEDQDSAAMRYRLLEPVRQYAQEQLKASGEWEATRSAHAAYFLALAEEAELGVEGRHQRQWMARLEREHDNMRAVLGRCLEAAEPETALRIGSALWLFWRQQGYRAEGERWLEEGLEAQGGSVPAAVRAKALRQVAELANAQSDFRRAASRFQQALALWRDLGEASGTAGTLLHYGRVLSRLAQTSEERQQAVAMLEESLALYYQPDQFWGAGWALQNIGLAAWEWGDLERAAAVVQEGVLVLERGGGHHLRSHLVEILGRVAADTGDLKLATDLIEESLAESRATGCGEGVAAGLHTLARVARKQGDLTRARSLGLESLHLFHRLGLRYDAAQCLALLGSVAGDASQPERAARLLAAADGLRQATGVPVHPVHRQQHEQEVARARQALGSRRFAVAWKAGVESGLDDAVEYADQAAVVAPSTVRPAIPADPLTRREREVAGLVASGLTNKVIAERLVISERTVDGHVANVLGKLVLRSRAQVAVWAVEHNLAPTSA